MAPFRQRNVQPPQSGDIGKAPDIADLEQQCSELEAELAEAEARSPPTPPRPASPPPTPPSSVIVAWIPPNPPSPPKHWTPPTPPKAPSKRGTPKQPSSKPPEHLFRNNDARVGTQEQPQAGTFGLDVQTEASQEQTQSSVDVGRFDISCFYRSIQSRVRVANDCDDDEVTSRRVTFADA